MNQKELKELIEFLIEKDIAEFELERGDVKLRVKRGGAAPVIMSVPQVPVPVPATVLPVTQPVAAGTGPTPAGMTAPPEPDEADLFIVKSPIVGTFYEAPSPGSPPFFKIGDAIEAGQVLCIIEAMKLMNEIEAEVAGELVKRMVKNGQPVEYGQPLFAVRPRK